MKRALLSLTLAVFALTAIAGNVDGSKLSVDSKSSTMAWKGSKVTGSHVGTVAIQSGSVETDGKTITAATVNIDMKTIACTDADMNDEYKGKLVGHLNSPDFFNVAEHGTATFNLSKFEAKKGENGANYLVTGKLTIKGITQVISFPATVSMKDGEVIVEAKVVIDRTKWDIKYGSGSFFDSLGDNMIYDDMEIDFRLVAKA